jgi:hypothetical protein
MTMAKVLITGTETIHHEVVVHMSDEEYSRLLTDEEGLICTLRGHIDKVKTKTDSDLYDCEINTIS